ncbi:MAG: tetrahydromethanopterin S-methyltransferase subunit A [Planctomycetota bacterium]|jgi:tetrahydromethanopterin S-methyltransferase subunit A
MCHTSIVALDDSQFSQTLNGKSEFSTMSEIRKVEPSSDYPPEEGCYLRGNDYSPVVVVVILRWMREKTPPDIERLVRTAVESGAALSGTLQTENIGMEKVICNVVSNPNIRHLIVCGPESPGHLVGDAILALVKNGMDGRKRIIGAQAPTPYLFNIPLEFVERFREQITVIDLINEGSPDVLRQAVWSCYQEKPTSFRQYKLYDPGAYPAAPLSGRITWRVIRPSEQPINDEERAQREKIQTLMERIKKAAEKKRHPPSETPPDKS